MRTVAVFTGNRAEFGLQVPLLVELKKSKEFNLVLIVAASHVDPEFGLTVQEIKKNGFAYFINFLRSSFLNFESQLLGR